VTEYLGSPWRSRFLRAPKLALGLAERPDFVPLGELATLRLGLKTGADKFFFLRRSAERASNATVAVVGLDGGWSGSISTSDLRPAARNPHELFGSDGARHFAIPRLTPSMYLAPRDRPPEDGLREYITAGEHRGINRTKLVVSNADADRWFRQTRGVVTSPWALPYNSGYDYGAWANPHGAVLNGRFVGVSPEAESESAALGAVLNSTFTMMTRLLEGTATGVEGAFDVGPPAARRMAVPDPSLFSAAGRVAVVAVMDAWRREDVMPPGPDNDGRVHPKRHQLDVAILEALGMSKGEASALTGRVYESYARWRRAIESVETMMRANRREMARNRSGRSVKPADIAAQRVWEELQAEMPTLPSDLLSGDEEIELVEVPRKLGVRRGQPALLPGLLFHHDGSQTDLGSFERVRYAEMLLTIGFEPPLGIPGDSVRAGAIVDTFDRGRARLIDLASRKASAYVGDEEAIRSVVKLVERQWLRACRLGGFAGARPS